MDRERRTFDGTGPTSKASSHEPDELQDVLAEQRIKLMQADTVLQCASLAYDYAGAGVIYFPNIASVVSSLINDVVSELDVTRARKRNVESRDLE